MKTAPTKSPRPEAQELMPVIQGSAPPRVESIPVTKARSKIGQLIYRVHVDKDHIVLEKSGIPVAALIDIDEFKQYLAFREANPAK